MSASGTNTPTSAEVQTGPGQEAIVQPDEEVYTIETRKPTKKIFDDDEPLVDTTEALQLRSKKTERLQKRQQKRLKKTTVQSDTKSFLELPHELLHEVLAYLLPSDIIRLQRLNKATAAFIQDNESIIARDIIQRRYWVLARSLPLPVPLSQVSLPARASLQSQKWQDRLQIHKKPYQHVRPIDPQQFCTCMTCVIAWNTLCVVLDLAHFQTNFNNREPLPIIPRGTDPKWNSDLIRLNAEIVEKAVQSPLHYARILEAHLATTVGTINRQYRVGKKTSAPNPKRLYQLSPIDVEDETDVFLERSGPPTLDFPFHRDRYHYIEAYVPNRGWSKLQGRWMYQYASPRKVHESDLEWTMKYYKPDPAPVTDHGDLEKAIEEVRLGK
ncbi:uncharacterized protein RCC_08997 [Ramularia collo-cygni]|uniref:F-box domain-containing protein n=1 Tax=Ramularia collo-cygni TaxID=112498 RepID=A0A2D3V1L4_9PEZI|nr:uncharacterized protein RCC_08997 [Ramularia collo-cygni]CZT23286.1 uncharacterized protein RCC_08997 [Ramularia collo-cygni]